MKIKFYISIIILSILIPSCASKKTYTYRSAERQLDSRPKENVRVKILISALKYVGVDYRYGGKSPTSGFDCSGFITHIFKVNGIKMYGNSKSQSKKGRKTSLQSAQPGDLVFFGSSNRVGHVAVVLSNKGKKLEVVHATKSKGVRIDEILGSDYWMSRYLFTKDVIAYDEYISVSTSQ